MKRTDQFKTEYHCIIYNTLHSVKVYR